MVFLSNDIIELCKKYKEQNHYTRLDVLKELVIISMNLDGENLPIGKAFVLPSYLNLYDIKITLSNLGFYTKIQINDDGNFLVILS